MRKRFAISFTFLSGLVILGSIGVQALQAPTPSVLDQVSVEQLIQGPQGPPYVPQGPIAIVGGLLIDATDAPPLPPFAQSAPPAPRPPRSVVLVALEWIQGDPQ